MISKIEVPHLGFSSFLSSFSGLLLDWVFQGAKGPPGNQNERFWLHCGSKNWSKMAPKMIQNTYQKIHSKIIEKWSQKGFQNGGTPMTGRLLFELFFWNFLWIGFFKVPRAFQGAKMNDFGSQNEPPKLKNGDQNHPADTENARQAADA